MSEKSLSAVVLLLVLGTGVSVWHYVEGGCGCEPCPDPHKVDVPFDRDAFLGLAAAYKPMPTPREDVLEEQRGVPDGALVPAVHSPRAAGPSRPLPAVYREPSAPAIQESRATGDSVRATGRPTASRRPSSREPAFETEDESPQPGECPSGAVRAATPSPPGSPVMTTPPD